jgi:hypothetical protein
MVAASTPPPRAPTGGPALAATVAAVLCAALLSAGAGTPRAGRPGTLPALAARQVSLEQVALWDSPSPMNPSLCATQVWHVFGYKHRETERARACGCAHTYYPNDLSYLLYFLGGEAPSLSACQTHPTLPTI